MTPNDAASKGRRPRILVTGASGFIGTHVVQALVADGLPVRAHVWDAEPRRSELAGVEVVTGDIRNERDVARAVEGMDWVLHLAGKAHDVSELGDAGVHDAITAVGTRHVVDRARSLGVHSFVFVSSLAVYAPTSDRVDRALDEQAPLGPTTPYGVAKLAAQRYVLEHADRMHVCCIQPAMVYGPGCRGNLRRMLSMIDRGLFPPIPALDNRRSLAYVDDVVKAIRIAAENPRASGKCFIVTDGQVYSTTRIYEALCQGLGRSLPRWRVPVRLLKWCARAGDLGGRARGARLPFDSDAYEKLVGSAWFSSTRIQHELDIVPSGTLESSLPAIVERYREERG